MKIVNALDGTTGLIDNLSFDSNVNKDRAIEAMDNALRDKRYQSMLGGFTCGFDEDTGDVLFFLPLSDLHKSSEEDQQKFLKSIKKYWADAQFEILDNREIDGDVYFHVGYASYFFRLKSLI